MGPLPGQAQRLPLKATAPATPADSLTTTLLETLGQTDSGRPQLPDLWKLKAMSHRFRLLSLRAICYIEVTNAEGLGMQLHNRVLAQHTFNNFIFGVVCAHNTKFKRHNKSLVKIPFSDLCTALFKKKKKKNKAARHGGACL